MPEAHICVTRIDRQAAAGLSLNRRDLVVGMVAGGLGIGGYAYSQGEGFDGVAGAINNTTSKIDEAVTTPDAEDRPWDHHVGNRTFDGYSFVDSRLLKIWMPAEHPSIDWLRLYHEYDEVRDGSLYETASIPRYNGTVEIDLSEAVGDGTFPTPMFKIIASRGIWSNYEAIDWFTFELPSALADRAVSSNG